MLQISAARDKQTAADTARLSGHVSTGAATFAFIQVSSLDTPYSFAGAAVQIIKLVPNPCRAISADMGFEGFRCVGFLDRP